ncbi:uncharacterized protein LOC116416860 [Nasonia vitripennis]|uniref:Uncharacterized protein n=1 Tax=Nasonia vitripennis TaxID=7425 RepID=A0A7M7T8Q8_NASVI|nr:uncharacterized protein LOC116416860 [Nasonia vitripennis]
MVLEEFDDASSNHHHRREERMNSIGDYSDSTEGGSILGSGWTSDLRGCFNEYEKIRTVENLDEESMEIPDALLEEAAIAAEENFSLTERTAADHPEVASAELQEAAAAESNEVAAAEVQEVAAELQEAAAAGVSAPTAADFPGAPEPAAPENTLNSESTATCNVPTCHYFPTFKQSLEGIAWRQAIVYLLRLKLEKNNYYKKYLDELSVFAKVCNVKFSAQVKYQSKCEWCMICNSKFCDADDCPRRVTIVDYEYFVLTQTTPKSPIYYDGSFTVMYYLFNLL